MNNSIVNRLANAAAERQLRRSFARGLRLELRPLQLQFVRSLIVSGVTEAIEEWEQGRAVRERNDFYESSDSLPVRQEGTSPR